MSCPAPFKYVFFHSVYLPGYHYHGVTDCVCVSLYKVKQIARHAFVWRELKKPSGETVKCLRGHSPVAHRDQTFDNYDLDE